jgi:hypothetical protein
MRPKELCHNFQENSLTFTTFVVNLAMEGLCDKYGDQVNLDRQNWTILKNKKYMGTLQRHHIQQRPGKKLDTRVQFHRVLLQQLVLHTVDQFTKYILIFHPASENKC